MENKQYAAIVNYLEAGVYPEGLAKGFSQRTEICATKNCKEFHKVENEKLYYCDLNRDAWETHIPVTPITG